MKKIDQLRSNIVNLNIFFQSVAISMYQQQELTDNECKICGTTKQDETNIKPKTQSNIVRLKSGNEYVLGRPYESLYIPRVDNEEIPIEYKWELLDCHMRRWQLNEYNEWGDWEYQRLVRNVPEENTIVEKCEEPWTQVTSKVYSDMPSYDDILYWNGYTDRA